MWTKDDKSESPRVIYTPTDAKENGVTRIVFDPDANASRRWTIELTHITALNESKENAEDALDVKTEAR